MATIALRGLHVRESDDLLAWTFDARWPDGSSCVLSILTTEAGYAYAAQTPWGDPAPDELQAQLVAYVARFLAESRAHEVLARRAFAGRRKTRR